MFFCGTFTAQGLEIEVDNQNLHIAQEGKQKKFIKQVEQITFSASQALSNHKPVMYITERAVFQLTQNGLELIEIAPGMDLERDILQKMEFTPVISPSLKTMPAAIFQPAFELTL